MNSEIWGNFEIYENIQRKTIQKIQKDQIKKIQRKPFIKISTKFQKQHICNIKFINWNYYVLSARMFFRHSSKSQYLSKWILYKNGCKNKQICRIESGRKRCFELSILKVPYNFRFPTRETIYQASR